MARTTQSGIERSRSAQNWRWVQRITHNSHAAPKKTAHDSIMNARARNTTWGDINAATTNSNAVTRSRGQQLTDHLIATPERAAKERQADKPPGGVDAQPVSVWNAATITWYAGASNRTATAPSEPASDS
jgi:hypothetical protein